MKANFPQRYETQQDGRLKIFDIFESKKTSCKTELRDLNMNRVGGEGGGTLFIDL